MGWLFGWDSKESLVSHCLTGGAKPRDYSALAHSIVGNNLWVVFERNADAPLTYEREGREPYVLPDRVLCLYLLQGRKHDGWGYKDLDESMGPSETNVPLKYLAMVPDPGGYATAWRERVKACRAAKNAKGKLLRTLKPGMRVKLYDGCKPAEVVIASVAPLTGYADGLRYRIAPRYVEAVL